MPIAWLQTSGLALLMGPVGTCGWSVMGDGSWEDLVSFVVTQPERLAAAAGSLQEVGSAVSAQSAAAVAPTTSVAPAAADQVSALTAARFSAHAQLYQMVSAQAVAIHDRLVAALAAGAQSYEAAEAANVIAAG